MVATLGVLAFLAVPAIAGYEVGRQGGPAPAGSGAAFVPETTPAPSSGSAARQPDLAAVADAADDAVVNITTRVEGGGEAAGTGIVISSNGLVLTNNHVIAGTTGLTVELTSTGVTRPARVLGYSVVDDVALIQVQNVSNLTAARIGSSTSLAIGDTVLALGNAGGRGGSPTVVSGTVLALDQEITASDADGSNAQTIDGLIQLAANIQSGDSGGPVVDTDGTVVGMNVAASVSNSFGFGSRAGGEGYAIPIEQAIAIAKKIMSGEGGPDIRVGATRGVLGVQIQPQLTNQRVPGGTSGSGSGGARVVGVESGSGADDAGLEAGDVIIALGGRTIASTNDLTRALVPYGPGEKVEVTWRDSSGQTRRAQIELGEGPPA
jgi:S1-C subfamily serine protease